mgnify:FL=1
MDQEVKHISQLEMIPVERAVWLESPFEGSAVYRLELQMKMNLNCRVAFAAIPGFIIILNGIMTARSSVQYTHEQVFYETFELNLVPGSHVLEVLVVDYQGCAPLSRVERPNGFFCTAPDMPENVFDTGTAPWRCSREPRYSFKRQDLPHFQCVGGVLTFDSRLPVIEEYQEPLSMERGADAWTFRQTACQCRRLSPSPLPPFCRQPVSNYKIRHIDNCEEHTIYPASCSVINSIYGLEVPANSVRRILLELDDYYCADYELLTSRGAGSHIRVAWAEGLFIDQKGKAKGRRDVVEDKWFIGIHDCFISNGEHNRFFNIDYRAGRYVELLIRTSNEALRLEDFRLKENRYPLEWKGALKTGNRRFDQFAAKAFRTLQMCAHDTFMDCPYYEQLMYIGDGRLQLLTAYVTTEDLRLADHAVMLWGEGLRNEGLFVSLYPARTCQIIPAFSMLYIVTVADYIRWRNVPEVTSRIFPLALRSLMALEEMVNEDGLLQVGRGWLFIDWAEGWEQGVPPTERGVSCIFNALYLYVLGEFIEACEMLGETEFAARFRKKSQQLYNNIFRYFYRKDETAFSDLPDKSVFSEHANALMLLSPCMPEEIAEKVADTLFSRTMPMVKTTVYFSFYYLEAAIKHHRTDAFFERLELWYEMEPLGLKTLLESPEPSRSDCHAWSSHVLYHLYASVAGLRPTEAGGQNLRCDPQLGHLESLSGSLPTGFGQVDFELTQADGKVIKNISLK